MNATTATRHGLLVSQDLFFSSQVTGTAEKLGFQIDLERDPAQAAKRIQKAAYCCIILDLALAHLDPAALAGNLPAEKRPTVLAFGAHVHTGRLEEARQAGCDEVFTRGQFSSDLPNILRQHLGG